VRGRERRRIAGREPQADGRVGPDAGPTNQLDQIGHGHGGQRAVARPQALLLERPPPRGEGALDGDVAQRLAAKQVKRLSDERRRADAIRPGPRDQRLEPRCVERVAVGVQRIAGRPVDQQPADGRAHFRQVHVQSGDGARRRLLAPQLVDQPVPSQRRAGAVQHQRQQETRPPGRQGHRLPVSLARQRAEHSEPRRAGRRE
jgi:hypothetical protein